MPQRSVTHIGQTDVTARIWDLQDASLHEGVRHSCLLLSLGVEKGRALGLSLGAWMGRARHRVRGGCRHAPRCVRHWSVNAATIERGVPCQIVNAELSQEGATGRGVGHKQDRGQDQKPAMKGRRR